MLDPKILSPGKEQHESFRSSINKKTYIQYDYRHTTGELFSCVKPSLDACRGARDSWVKQVHS